MKIDRRGRVLRAVLAAALVMGITAAPAVARGDGSRGKDGKLSGEYVATQAPMASYMATDYCDLAAGGVAHFPFKAPAEGVYEASMQGFRGDWDMWVMDERKEYITGSWNTQSLLTDDQIGEELSAPVEKGDRITLIACNYSGQPEVTIKWRFRPVSYSELLGGSDLSEELPINLVFLGYDERAVDTEAFTKKLPKASQPIIRSRSWYGKTEGLGIRYTFDYNIGFAPKSYEDRFFGYLKDIGQRTQPTFYQNQYNAQASKVLTIDDNLEIDAAKVERWLADNPPDGVDTTENTVFFINWHGRRDFRFHVYSLKSARDTDSKYDWAATPTHKLMAWGGTPHDGTGPVRRVWFHDLSAGPDWRTQNWNVDAPAPGVMPPVWEYSRDGLRAPDRVTKDLAKVARYVAIDFFFTPSPIYPVSITPPELPTDINLDMNVYEGDRGTDASKDLLNQKEIIRELEGLQPLNTFSADDQDRDFFEPKQLECFGPHAAGWQVYQLWTAPSCYKERPYTSYANLFLFSALNLDQTLDTKKSDYEATGTFYMLPEDNAATLPYLGLADDNYRDGTQSFIYVAMSPALKPYYGMTDVAIHEYGHHFGMSHMHDGYDFEDRKHIGPYGSDTYMWVGDEVNSVMSYLQSSNGFSQFERDNMARYLTAAYLQETRAIAMEIVDSADNGDTGLALDLADAWLGQARAAFSKHRYSEAVRLARDAYEEMVRSAGRVGVRLVGDRSGTTPLDEPGQKAAGVIKNYYSMPVSQLPMPLPHDH